MHTIARSQLQPDCAKSCRSDSALHEIGESRIICVVTQYSFNISSDLRFEAAKVLTPRSIHIVKQSGRGSEILHQAKDRKSTTNWINQHPHIDAVTAVIMAKAPALQSA
jgi:hypothetical protein